MNERQSGERRAAGYKATAGGINDCPGTGGAVGRTLPIQEAWEKQPCEKSKYSKVKTEEIFSTKKSDPQNVHSSVLNLPECGMKRGVLESGSSLTAEYSVHSEFTDLTLIWFKSWKVPVD